MRAPIIATVALVAALAAVLTAADAHAYFELDESLIGTPTRTVLPDGRIHLRLQDKENEPFPAGAKFPAVEGVDESAYPELTDAAAKHHYSVHGTAVMQGHWQIFKLDEHVADVASLICHDQGDKNMRISLFGVSPKLRDYLTTKVGSVVLTSSANKHVCHGAPIFRKVTSVRFFAASDEALLVTDNARYEELFDEAHIKMSIKHPKLTHMHSERPLPRFDRDARDHGVVRRDADETQNRRGASVVASATAGSAAVPASYDRMYPRDASSSSSQAARAAGEEEESAVMHSERRRAVAQGLFKKLKKAVSKAVSKVVTTVKKTVSNVVQSVGKGITSVVNAVKNLLTVNCDIDKNLSVPFSKTYNKVLKGVEFDFEFDFEAGLDFELLIETNVLRKFHASVYGELEFTGGAELPARQYDDTAQSVLYTIGGPRITFAIGPVPVWIDISVPIIGGYDIGVGYSAQVGFTVNAYARLGVEYTKASGFRMISERSFTKSHTLKYDLEFNAAPFLAAQAKFSLYSMVAGYAQLNVGLDVLLTTRNSACLIKLTADLFVRLSAGLDIEIGLLGFKIYEKSYGPSMLYQNQWSVVNVCTPRNGGGGGDAAAAAAAARLEMMAEHVDDARRLASAQGVQATLSLGPDDSGKVWSTLVTCSPAESYNFQVTGFFDDNATLLWLSVSRNLTLPVNGTPTYFLAQQGAIAYIDSALSLGMSARATLVAPTVANAVAFGLDGDALEALSQVASSDEANITALPITYLDVSFSPTDLASATFSNPNLCSPPGAPAGSVTAASAKSNTTAPPPPPPGSFFGRMFAAFGKSILPSFLRLVTDVLVVVLAIAALEIVAAYLAPRFVGTEHFPKLRQTPRTREKVYAVVSVAVGLLCCTVFVVGSNLTFAEIVGAQLAANYTAPVNANPESFLVASGVDTIVWRFTGASIARRQCTQFYPCSPNCRDLCKTSTFSWTDAPWPYCPSDSVATEQGGCTKFAFDAALNAAFAVAFLVVGPVVALLKFDTVYRRLPVLHACVLLAGMFLALLWRRMGSFMKEVQLQMFSPADRMIIPFELYMNSDSQQTWEGAVGAFFVMAGLVGFGCMYDIYAFYKDTLEGRMVKFDDTFDVSGINTHGEPVSSYKDAADVDEAFADTVAADLAGLSVVNDNELALM